MEKDFNEHILKAIGDKYGREAPPGFTESTMKIIHQEREIRQNRKMLLIMLSLFSVYLFIFLGGLYTNINLSNRIHDFAFVQFISGFLSYWQRPIVQIILLSISTTLLLDMILKKRLKVSV